MKKGIRALALAVGFALAIMLAGLPAAHARAGLVAPKAKCSGQANFRASEHDQEKALRCLINHARSNPRSHRALERAAGRKVGDIFDCGFSHTACSRPFDIYPQRFGYTSGTSGWRLGENLAWGKRKDGSARQIFKAWLNSPPHRSTMLNGAFEHMGVGLKIGRFAGQSHVAVWVLQMGCRGC
jgi:hypothetical protein